MKINKLDSVVLDDVSIELNELKDDRTNEDYGLQLVINTNGYGISTTKTEINFIEPEKILHLVVTILDKIGYNIIPKSRFV